MSMTQQSQQMQQTSGGWYGNKTPLTIDAVIPDVRSAQQLVTEFTQDQNVREVTFRRDNDGTPHIRLSLRPEAVGQFQQHLQKLAEPIQRSYQSAGYGQQ